MNKKIVPIIALALIFPFGIISCQKTENIEVNEKTTTEIQNSLFSGDYETVISLLKDKIETKTANTKEIIAYTKAIIGKLEKNMIVQELDKAKELLTSILEEKEELSAIYKLLGDISQLKNELKKAKELYMTSLNKDANNKESLIALAQVNRKLGLFEEAIKNLNMALSIGDLYNDIVYSNLGEIYYLKKEYETAKKYFKETVSITQNRKLALQSSNNLAMVFFTEKKYKEAEIILSNVLKEEPNFYKARLNIGRVFLEKLKEKLRTDEAENVDPVYARAAAGELGKSIALQPDRTMGYIYLGDLFQIMGNDDFKIHYKKALEVIDSDIFISKEEKENIKNILKNNL